MNRRHSPTASNIGITPWISSEQSLQSVDSNHDRTTVYLWPLNQRLLVVLPFYENLWSSMLHLDHLLISSCIYWTEWFSNINLIPVFPYQQLYRSDLIVGYLTIKINNHKNKTDPLVCYTASLGQYSQIISF